MADESKIFRPRRGKKSTMESTKSGIVLADGELFVEYPSATDMRNSKIKIGDGITTYAQLPYVIGDTSKDPIPFEVDTSTEIGVAINKIITNCGLSVLIAAIRQALVLLNTDMLDHEQNTDIHVTTGEKTNWSSAYSHSTSAHAPSTAERNTITTIQKNGNNIAPTAERIVNISVPVKVSDLENDVGFINTDKDTKYTMRSVNDIPDDSTVKLQLVDDANNIISTIPISGSGFVSVSTDVNGNIVITGTNPSIDYVHPESGVIAGIYRSVTVDKYGHITAGTNPTTLSGYGITDAANKVHTHVSNDIVSLDSSKLTGTIPIELIPKGAIERCAIVTDDTARFALTINDVQNGDTVKVNSTGMMYFVKDDTKLNLADGYEEYSSGSATSVAWSGITGKPLTFAPSAHSHAISDITSLQNSLDNKAPLIHSHNNLIIDGNTYNGGEAKNINIRPFIKGTQTAAGAAWTGTAPTIDRLYDGLNIIYYLPYSGDYNATLELTLADSSTTGPINCYYTKNMRLGLQFNANSVINLIYLENINISGTLYTGWWVCSESIDNDKSVIQNNTTVDEDRRLLLSSSANNTYVVTGSFKSDKFTANPATGELYAYGYKRVDITGLTIDLNIYNICTGYPSIIRFINKTIAGATNISNIPITNKAFVLDVELVGWVSTSSYVTMQTLRSSEMTVEYVRYCVDGVWGSWISRVFTDTTYEAVTQEQNGLMTPQYREICQGLIDSAGTYDFGDEG